MPKTARGLAYSIEDFRPPWVTSGLPIVFNHGIGTNRDIWAEWVPIVASRRKMVRFDMRGFGQSIIPPETHQWSMEEMVADLWEVADLAGAEKVHLFGESMGGTIALAATVARPERVASVSISNASYKGKGLGELAYWQQQFADGGAKGWSRRMMENRFGPGVGTPEALAWFEQEQAKTQPHVAMGLGAVLAQSDLTEALKSLNVPISVVLPDSSPFVPVMHGAELRQIAPNVRLRVVPNMRHGLPFSHARSEARRLCAFLDEIEGNAG